MAPQPDSKIEFPCKFPIKVVGVADPEFEKAVIDIFNAHIPDFDTAAIEQRYSRDKKYLALTVTILATSQAQLDSIYIDLTNCSLVKFAL